MKQDPIPELAPDELQECLRKAAASPRRRHPKVLHQPGDEFNRVFNFMMVDTYMQPHLHPGEEKIERIHLVQGSCAVLIFNDKGDMEKISILAKEGSEAIEIPAFSWHTYVMLTEEAITYETMMGKYDPKTWKVLADWAPEESDCESSSYLNSLKEHVRRV